MQKSDFSTTTTSPTVDFDFDFFCLSNLLAVSVCDGFRRNGAP